MTSSPWVVIPLAGLGFVAVVAIGYGVYRLFRGTRLGRR